MLVGIMESERPVPLLVEAVMTRKVLTLNCQSSLLSAAELLRRKRIGAVPITDGNSLAGIITRSDILDAFIAGEGGDPRLKRRIPTLRSAPRGRAKGGDKRVLRLYSGIFRQSRKEIRLQSRGLTTSIVDPGPV